MELQNLLNKVKAHPDFAKAGMVLCHNGVVRESSRDGRKVTGLSVRVDEDKLTAIIERQRKLPGIVDIQIKINGGVDLKVGDDVMYLIVAGDVRENVIKVLHDTLNEVKTTVTSKTEFFIE